jgi:hypothetical protein
MQRAFIIIKSSLLNDYVQYLVLEKKVLVLKTSQDKVTGRPSKTKKKKQRTSTQIQKQTKRCKCCGRELPVDDFNYWNKEKGSRMSICKECEHEKSKAKRDYKKNLLIELKEVGCCVCGEKDPVCLDFHHYDSSEKEFNVSQALMKTLPDMITEASKCVIVCSNCHRKIHAGTVNIEDFISRHEYEYRKKLFALYAESLKQQDWNFKPSAKKKTINKKNENPNNKK